MRALRGPFLVLVLASLALAGCLDAVDTAATDLADRLVDGASTGVAHTLDGRVLPREPWATRGLQLPLGAESYEPTLGIDSAGALYMTAFDGMSPTVFRSRDGGFTWEDAGPKLPTGHGAHPFTADPYLYLDPATDRLWQNDNLVLAGAQMSYTDDGGETWTPSLVGFAPVAGPRDHQSMVAAKPRLVTSVGYPNVVYQCTNTAQSIECATSLDGGTTFGPAVTVFPRPEKAASYTANDCHGIHSHPAADSEGRVYVANAHCGVPTIALTEDDGLTWTQHVISEDVKQYPHILMHDVTLALDEADTVYAAWIAEDGLPHYAWSADHGATWSEPQRLAPPGITAAMLVDIEAAAPGRLVAAYVATDTPGGYGDKDTGGSGTVTDLEEPSEPAEWADARWHAYLTVLTDATGDAPVALTTMANDPADPVARGVCGKTRCGGMGDFLDVRIDPAGRPYAAFVDVCGAECAAASDATKDGAVGFVGTLSEGPALRGALRALPELRSAAAPHTP